MADDKKAAAPKADAPKAVEPKAESKAVENKINALTLEVSGAKHPLRITECGNKPFTNGDQIRLSADVANRFIEQYHPYLKKVGLIDQGVSLRNGYWEIVKQSEYSAPSPKGPAGDSGQALVDQALGSNKNMQGSSKAKTK